MGIIFQDFQLLHDRTVWKNFRFVLKATGWKDNDEINNRINEVLALVGLEDKLMKMPHELSGGEQQRLAIARAILNHPTIIIADEPTGNLDPETTGNIMSIFKKISEKGTAVVMTTHNISMISKVKATVYRCKEGRMGNVTAEFHDIDLSQELEFDE
jgi:cell division transport system ATP-binding protein